MGNRFDYVAGAYHFIDRLLAYCFGLTAPAGNYLDNELLSLGEKVNTLDLEFHTFLQDSAGKAFILTFILSDDNDPKFTVNDLSLDKEALEEKWNVFSSRIKQLTQ